MTSNETVADPYAVYRSFRDKEHRLADDQSSDEVDLDGFFRF